MIRIAPDEKSIDFEGPTRFRPPRVDDYGDMHANEQQIQAARGSHRSSSDSGNDRGL
jgi:hypothetical protein